MLTTSKINFGDRSQPGGYFWLGVSTEQQHERTFRGGDRNASHLHLGAYYIVCTYVTLIMFYI